jgi:hypothetical protein
MLRVLSVVAVDSRVYPRGRGRKRSALLHVAAVALAAAAAAGCGGGGRQEPAGQVVTGRGFTFRAPADWAPSVKAREAIAKRDETTLVSVTVLPLVKPYAPSLFPRVVGELDRVAETLAQRLHGEVASRRTAIVARRRVRVYELVHGDLVDQLTFVLEGKTEFLLTCRWRSDDGEPAACAELASTFELRPLSS